MMKHYIYKTTNLITKKFYIGKHSSQNIEIDTYLGSGILLERAIKKYGKHNFKKQILYTYQTEEQALQKQRQIVNQQFVKQEDTYNMTLGGHGSWQHVKGLIPVKDEFGNNLLVKGNDPRILSGQLKSIFKSTMWITNGKCNKRIKNDSLIPIGWWKGRKMSLDYLKGQNNPTRNKIWINNGKQERRIEKDRKIPSGWKRGLKPGHVQVGQNHSFYGSKMWITNGKQNKFIEKDISIPQGWKRGRAVNSQWITNGKQNKLIKLDDSIPFGWKRGRIL